MRDVDIIALPTYYPSEAFPISIIEAMSVGLPIVATNVGGVPDMVKNASSGLLCMPTEKSLYENIAKMIEDEELRESCGKKGIETANEKFSSKTMAENYMKIYKCF